MEKGALLYDTCRSVLSILFPLPSVQPGSLPSPSVPKKIGKGNHCVRQKGRSRRRSAECTQQRCPLCLPVACLTFGVPGKLSVLILLSGG